MVATAGAGLLVTAAFLFIDVSSPQDAGRFLAAYLVGALAIASTHPGRATAAGTVADWSTMWPAYAQHCRARGERSIFILE
jgi:hypothetical protein